MGRDLNFLSDYKGDILKEIALIPSNTQKCPCCHNKLEHKKKVLCVGMKNNEKVAYHREMSYCSSCHLYFSYFRPQNFSMPSFSVTYGKKNLKTSLQRQIFHKIGRPTESKSDLTTKDAPASKMSHNFSGTVDILPIESAFRKIKNIPKSTILVAECGRDTSGKTIRFVIVSDFDEQSSAKKIFEQTRNVSFSIKRCIVNRQGFFTYQDKQYFIKRLFLSDDLRLSLEMEKKLILHEIEPSGFVDVYLYNNKPLCRNHGKLTQYVRVQFMGTRSDLPHRLFVYYCPICCKYYVNQISYIEFCQKYGIPPLRIAEIIWSADWDSDFAFLNKQSPLNIYGYNVNQKDGLSDSERQRILEDIIDSGVMTKAQVISYLELFIKQQGSIPKNQYAKMLWQKDKDYIKGYKANFDRIPWANIVLPSRRN